MLRMIANGQSTNSFQFPRNYHEKVPSYEEVSIVKRIIDEHTIEKADR